MLPKRTYRYEQKYLITGPQYQELRPVVAALLRPDPNAGPDGTYMIRSLYFDDVYRTAYQEKQNGIYARKKYRVRVYNCRDSQIHLECKYKQGSYISKESLSLTRPEYQQLAGGDCRFLLGKDSQMGREFCADTLSRLLRPDVIVDYEREPYVMEAGTVRVTFDGVVYDHSFNVSLVVMTILTAVIIVTISSNVMLSLGMVGALSIVRYRTAVKSPMDLMFLFWAITTGIAVGAATITLRCWPSCL